MWFIDKEEENGYWVETVICQKDVTGIDLRLFASPPLQSLVPQVPCDGTPGLAPEARRAVWVFTESPAHVGRGSRHTSPCQPFLRVSLYFPLPPFSSCPDLPLASCKTKHTKPSLASPLQPPLARFPVSPMRLCALLVEMLSGPGLFHIRDSMSLPSKHHQG